ncbi:MAG: LapA family protein [Alphaproteobacteria bacterium]|nr:LapA family protein [Alphaproteobacteria bacterium]
MIGRLLSAILTFAVMAGAVLLAIGNPSMVAVSIWPFAEPFSLPLWLLVVVCFGSGLILGGVAMLWPLAQLRMTIRGLRKSLNKLEKEKLDNAEDKPALPHKSN